MKTSKTLVLALFAGLGLATVSRPAVAEQAERVSPLAGAPAIRHRVELRQTRFEIGAGIGAALNPDFYQPVLVNVRAAFHIADWLSIGGVFSQNLTPDLKTGYTDKVTDRLPKTRSDGTPARQPTQSEALDTIAKVNYIISPQLEIVPFTGKFAMFNRLFAAYDFYLFGGPGLVNYKADGQECAGGSGSGGCPDVGTKLGANFGVGFHTFFNQWLALNVELRDIFLKNNPSGRDTNADINAMGQPLVSDADKTWGHNVFLGANLTFFLPTTANVSD